VLGVIDDVAHRTPRGFSTDGALIYLLGDTREEFAGSTWMTVVHDYLGGHPPEVDLARERVLADVLITASREGLIDSAADLAGGGLARALVTCCLRHDFGARVLLPDSVSPFVSLFSESAGRAVVTVPRSAEAAFTDLCGAYGLPHAGVGVVDVFSTRLDVQDQFVIGLAELREAWTGTLPRLFG
jgi:phosphoribosylformylglycinamidine synthase subunit PurL